MPALSEAALIAQARDSIARGSKSFAMASRLFDPRTRTRAWLLYAWCRACDDSADGQDHGGALAPVDDPQARLATMRARTEDALHGRPTGDPAYDGLALVIAQTGLPRRYVDDLIEGFALDAQGWRPRTTDDLLRYCYHVAGSVGCMMAVVMGVGPEDAATLDRACDLGLAFQLANIARDLHEDARAGRCYVPSDWLDAQGITAESLTGSENRRHCAAIGARLATLAGHYEASARHGTPMLPLRSAWAVLAAAGIYGDIARAVAQRGEAACDERIVTLKSAKLGWMARAAAQAALRGKRWPATAPRDPDLWTRPGR